MLTLFLVVSMTIIVSKTKEPEVMIFFLLPLVVSLAMDLAIIELLMGG